VLLLLVCWQLLGASLPRCICLLLGAPLPGRTTCWVCPYPCPAHPVGPNELLKLQHDSLPGGHWCGPPGRECCLGCCNCCIELCCCGFWKAGHHLLGGLHTPRDKDEEENKEIDRGR
jgi:hypothetical protein